MIYTALTEAFFTFLKVSFYGALFISFPVIALYKFINLQHQDCIKKKKSLSAFFNCYASIIWFRSSFSLLFYFSSSLEIFLGFQTSTIESGMAIELEAKVNEYLSLVLKLMFAFGLAFQIPVALTLLSRAGIVHSDDLKKEESMQ